MRLLKPLCLLLTVLFVSTTRAQETLSLEQALALASQLNPRLRAVHARREGWQQRSRVAAAMLQPQVSVSGWMAQGSLVNMLASAPGAMPEAMRMADRGSFASTQLKLAMPLYTGGRLQNMSRSAQADVEAMSAEVQETEQDVRLEVTMNYMHTLWRRELIDVAQKRLEAQREQTRIMQQMLEAGKVPLAFVLRSRAAEAEAEQQLSSALNDYQKSLIDLQVSIGMMPKAHLSLSDDSTAISWVLPPSLEDAVKQAIEQRALLQGHYWRLRALNLERKAAEGALYPQAYLTASQDWLKAQGMLSQSGYTVALVVSLPLWSGGQLQAQAREAAAREREQAENLRQLQLQVVGEVTKVWLDIQTAQKKLSTARSALYYAEEAYRVAALRVSEGKAPLAEQIDALATLTDARTRLIEAQVDDKLSQARLLRAVGRL